MIQVGNYYRSDTPQGTRTIKCMQLDANDNPYGIYSISDCEHEGDSEGMIIPLDSSDASPEESKAWDIWFNQ